MLQENGDNFLHFQSRLVELGPLLNQLANASKIIWLNQHPTVEFYGNMNERNTDIHTQKINFYNKEVRRIFKLVKLYTLYLKTEYTTRKSIILKLLII
jgi:hypothetical protein